MRIVANLLCEWEWTGANVPQRLVHRTSALGTLLAALGREGDTLWTPTPIDAARVRPAPGLSPLTLESGELGALSAAGLLAWGETDATARARPAECALRPAANSDHWLDVVRSLRAPTADTQRRVCDRRLQLAFARGVGLALEAAFTAESVEDVLATPPARAGERWVAKAPWSASGRERLRGRGNALSGADRTRLTRLFDVHGSLVVEPWLDRTGDFGALGVVRGGTVLIVGFHRVITSGGGAWRGIRPLGTDAAPEGLSDAEVGALIAALRAAGAWLSSEGYEGPFGIDAWRHRDADGTGLFHAFGELNARLTFGFVARRLAEAAGWSPHEDGRAPELRVGSASDLASAGLSAHILLQPGDDDGVAAWLQ